LWVCFSDKSPFFIERSRNLSHLLCDNVMKTHVCALAMESTLFLLASIYTWRPRSSFWLDTKVIERTSNASGLSWKARPWV
jgi:hypothetical protein